MIPEKVSLIMGDLPEGVTLENLLVQIDRNGKVMGIAPASCMYASRGEVRCELKRDVGIRKVGSPLACILCGKQTIIDFEADGQKEHQLLQCVLSPKIKR